MNINTLRLKPGIYRVNGTRHGYSRISDTFARAPRVRPVIGSPW